MDFKKLYLAFALTLTSLFSTVFAQEPREISFLKGIPLLPQNWITLFVVVLFFIIAYELWRVYGWKRGIVIGIIVVLYGNFIVAPVFNEAISNSSKYDVWSLTNLGSIFNSILTSGDFTGLIEILLYVITPFMLIFLMFYGVLTSLGPFRGTQLWGRSIEGWIAFFLSLLIVPSRWYMALFSALVGGLAGATAIYLYIGLFFLMAVWGYVNFYGRARMLAVPGGPHLAEMQEDQKLLNELVANLNGYQKLRTAFERKLLFGDLDKETRKFAQKSFGVDPVGDKFIRDSIRLDEVRNRIADTEKNIQTVKENINKARRSWASDAIRSSSD